MLTITHTHTDGTLIDGTSRGDGTNHALKANGWRWSRNLSAWYVPQSRDRAARADLIERTAAALRETGHQVETTIDDTARATADVEADRIQRQQDRADALTAKAARVAATAENAHDHAHEIAGRVPFGQPILIGHHSQGRMTRHYQRVENAQRQAVELHRQADDVAAAATAAAHTTRARYNPVTVGNRIEKIEAEIRDTRRTLDGYSRTHHVAADGTRHGDTFPPATGAHRDRLTAHLDELTEQLAHWQQVRADQIAAGTATNYGPDTIAKGDQVKIRGTWYQVIRANKKTVTVPSTLGSWTDTSPYREIQEHRTAS